jgi:hypothetical protein
MELTTKPESPMMLQRRPMMLQRRWITQRSINVMSAGLAGQDPDYARHIQEVFDELGQIQQTPRLVTSPEDLEALEHEIRQRTDHLGSLLVAYHMQRALDSAALQAEQEQLVRQWPQPAQERWHDQGEGTHGARVYRAAVGDL